MTDRARLHAAILEQLTHGPGTVAQLARELDIGPWKARTALLALAEAGRVRRRAFSEHEYGSDGRIRPATVVTWEMT